MVRSYCWILHDITWLIFKNFWRCFFLIYIDLKFMTIVSNYVIMHQENSECNSRSFAPTDSLWLCPKFAGNKNSPNTKYILNNMFFFSEVPSTSSILNQVKRCFLYKKREFPPSTVFSLCSYFCSWQSDRASLGIDVGMKNTSSR